MNIQEKEVSVGSPAALFPDERNGIELLDWSNIGLAFPIKHKRAYLNNASIGALSLPVVAAVNRYMEDVRDHGRNSYPEWCRYADETIKARIGRLIGAHRDEIAFVKNTTEGLINVANGFPWRDGDNLILPDIEYPSNVYCWMKLAARGVTIRWVKNRNGRILVDDIRKLMDDRTRLVSLSAVQFSNGFRHDLEATSNLCNERGVYLNLDAIQWAGALQLNVEKLGIHFLSVGGHNGCWRRWAPASSIAARACWACWILPTWAITASTAPRTICTICSNTARTRAVSRRRWRISPASGAWTPPSASSWR